MTAYFTRFGTTLTPSILQFIAYVCLIQIEVIRVLCCLFGVALLWFSSYHLPTDSLQIAMQKSLAQIESTRQSLRHP